jgi:hypothetical protein
MDYTASEVDVLFSKSAIWLNQKTHRAGELTAVVTVLTESKPVMNSTLLPFNLASTTWPPVTFVYEVFVNKVGINCEVLVIELARYVPVRTWYVRRLATSDGLVAASAPAVELRNAARAALLGARIVMFVALLRAETIPGWVARRPLREKERSV